MIEVVTFTKAGGGALTKRISLKRMVIYVATARRAS